jgi:hypothetical protein
MNHPSIRTLLAAMLAALLAATALASPAWAQSAQVAATPTMAATAASSTAATPVPSLLNVPPTAPATSAPPPIAPPTAGDGPASSLDSRIQDVKGDVIRLNRDLLVLEEELLFPASTQVALFVSMDVGKLFELESVQVRLDDKIVTNYLYTPREVQALHRGGVQRVYLGNLRAGTHELVAYFTGGGPHERDYKRGTTIKFDKGTEPRYIELQIKDSEAKLQPEFEVKVWQ